MDTIQLIAEISVLKKKMDKAEAFLEELVEYLLVTCKDDDYITPEVICRKLAKYGYIELEDGYWVNPLADRKTEPQTDCPQANICSKPCKECGACEVECGLWQKIKDEPSNCDSCETYWNCQGQCDEMPQITEPDCGWR